MELKLSLKRFTNLNVLLSGLVLSTACTASKKEDLRPNIIFILADDLGYMDVQAYAKRELGSNKEEMFYETPNIDRLINEGVAFDQAYACQLSSPTRASLLTGKYAAKLGFTTATPLRDTYYNQNIPVPEGSYAHDVIYHSDNISIEQALLNGSSNTALPAGTSIDDGRNEITIAETLKDYHSAFIGKWHVGGHGAKGYGPADQGFEPIAWYDGGGSAYFNWQNNWNNKSKTHFPEMPQAEWLIGNAGDVTGEDYLTDDLTQQALNYIDSRANIKEQPFFLYFCHFAVHSPFQAKEKDKQYFDSKTTKGWNNQNDPTYASMIKSLDESVGLILNKLEELELEENTLVVFMSDNGGIDGSVTPDGSITSNYPLKGGKANLTEGGIRVPLAFRWKGKIEGGKWCNTMVDCNDLFPTLVEAAGYDITPYYNETKIDGRSVLTLLNDTDNIKQSYSRDTYFWHYPFNVIYNNPFDNYPLTPHSAIREGDYKLIFDWYGRLKLFNIANDINENHNLSKAMPEKTNELFAKLMNWLSTNVEKTYWPKVNTDYNAKKEVRVTPFINLVDIYNEGGDVALKSN